MNALGLALIWCAAQVSLVALLALAIDLVLRRFRPSAAGPVVLSSLLVILVLSAAALSPWPCWSWGGSSETADAKDAAAPEAIALAGGEAETALADGTAGGQSIGTEGEGLGWADTVASYWQAFQEELRVGSEIQPTESWPSVVAWGFLAGAGISLVWLAAGIRGSSAYRRWSVPIDDAGLLEQVDVLRAELGCRAEVEVRQCDRLQTAATLGFFQPLVLVPAGWSAWSAEQRRAVLAHELAHVRSRDFLGVLCARLGQVLHFYHPLVYWLAARLRLEQELAADAAAAAVSGGQRAYLRAIAELALEQADRSIPWPARTFLPTRTTFLRRIAMLRDTNLALLRRAPLTRAVAVAAVLLGGLFAVGLRGPGVFPEAAAQEKEGATAQPAAAAPEVAAPAGEFDLKYLPNDAVAFFGIRPAAIFADKRMAGIRELLRESMRPDEGLPPVEEIEQIVYAVTRLPEKPNEVAVLMICRATKPESFDAFIRQAIPQAVEKQIDGQTYYYPAPTQPPPYSPTVCTRADDRTLVCGTPEALEDYQKAADKGQPGFLDADAWKEFRGDSGVVAFSSALPKRVVQWEAAREFQPAMVFAPIWDESRWGIAGLRLEDQLRLHAVVQGNDDAGAERVAETLEAVKVLVTNWVLGVQREELPSGEGALVTADQAFKIYVKPMLGEVERSLRAARFEREGRLVRFAASLKVEGAVLEQLLEGGARARKAAQRSLAVNNLKQIALAMHNYHDTYRHFPPPVLYSQSGVPYSWRVALLPFMEQHALYNMYNFDEPWDSPNNRRIAETIVTLYSNPLKRGSPHSAYYVLVGPETIFDDEKGTPFQEIRDGASNTLLVVEADRDIPWTKPEDIPYDATKPLPKLGGFFKDGFHAALGDGSVRFFSDATPADLLRALISRSGGEIIDGDRLLQDPGGAP